MRVEGVKRQQASGSVGRKMSRNVLIVVLALLAAVILFSFVQRKKPVDLPDLEVQVDFWLHRNDLHIFRCLSIHSFF